MWQWLSLNLFCLLSHRTVFIAMAKASGLCLSISPRDFKVHEAAQSSLERANRFFSCVSDEKQEKSVQELSLVAKEAVDGFKKLLLLLDEPKPSDDQKRIRKGPLPKTRDVNPSELMDSANSSLKNMTSKSSQPFVVRQFLPPQSNHQSPITSALVQRNSLIGLSGEKQNPVLQPCYYSGQTSSTVILPGNSMAGLSHFSQQPSNSMISMNGSSVSMHAIHYTSSELLASDRASSSMFSSQMKCGAKSDNTDPRCVASTGGCHCSKRR